MSKLLNRKVLVLNRSWVACHVVTLRRAIKLVYKNDAEIIDPTKAESPEGYEFQTFTWKEWSELKPKDDEDFISTARDVLRIPEVIVLYDFNKLPMQRINFSRRALFRRDNNTCQYCGEQPGTEELSIDHVLPKSMGGKTTWENCVLACVSCNAHKANRTPEQARMKLRREPFKPKFNLFKGDIRVKSWEKFLGEMYWNVTLTD